VHLFLFVLNNRIFIQGLKVQSFNEVLNFDDAGDVNFERMSEL